MRVAAGLSIGTFLSSDKSGPPRLAAYLILRAVLALQPLSGSNMYWALRGASRESAAERSVSSRWAR